jgi:hypothetical protein
MLPARAMTMGEDTRAVIGERQGISRRFYELSQMKVSSSLEVQCHNATVMG